MEVKREKGRFSGLHSVYKGALTPTKRCKKQWKCLSRDIQDKVAACWSTDSRKDSIWRKRPNIATLLPL